MCTTSSSGCQKPKSDSPISATGKQPFLCHLDACHCNRAGVLRGRALVGSGMAAKKVRRRATALDKVRVLHQLGRSSGDQQAQRGLARRIAAASSSELHTWIWRPVEPLHTLNDPSLPPVTSIARAAAQVEAPDRAIPEAMAMTRPEWPPPEAPGRTCHRRRPPVDPPSIRKSCSARWPASPPLASKSPPGSMERQDAPP